jgi:hypothetical protein
VELDRWGELGQPGGLQSLSKHAKNYPEPPPEECLELLNLKKTADKIFFQKSR